MPDMKFLTCTKWMPFLLGFCFLVGGCTTIKPMIMETEMGNKNLTVENILKIKKGHSTFEDIKKIFGDPDSMLENTPTEGQTTWTYIYTRTKKRNSERSVFQIDQTQLEIIFNKKEVVTEYIQTVSNRMKQDS